MRMRWIVTWLLFPALAGAADEGGRAALDDWLVRQVAVEHWQAGVEQEREFKGLSQPLRSAGRVWVSQPDRLRWELGEPPQTIAIRHGDWLTVHHPLLDETETFALGGEDISPAGRQAQALLEVGFPPSREAFFKAYGLDTATRDGDHWRFKLIPTSTATQRILDRVTLTIDAASGRLDGTEFEFPDGSVMRNRFSGQRTDVAPAAELFEPGR